MADYICILAFTHVEGTLSIWNTIYVILTGNLRRQWIKMYSLNLFVVKIHKSLWQQVALQWGGLRS